MKKPPTGVQLTPFDPLYLEDPYPVIAQLREQDPFHHDADLHRYFPCRYADVKAILRNSDLLTDPNNSRPDSFARHFLGREGEEVSMLFADEPRHLRLRLLVNDLFKPKAVESWRSRIEEVVDHFLDQIEGPDFDLIADFAEPVPTVVIAQMMGIPAERQEDFKRWSTLGIEAAFSPDPSEQALADAQESMDLLANFFLKEIESRRKSPGIDLISQLVASAVDGDSLTDEEIVAQCSLLLLAGNLTTTDMIGNGIRALLENPEQLAKLRDNPALIEATVEEILRYDSPVLNSSRITAQDIEYQGVPVAKGECLHVSLAGANRDPEVYENPDKLDIERPGIQHQSFGGGRHFCLGAPLARLEGQVAILRLLQRFPKLQLSTRGLKQSFVPDFRGMEYCWLSIS
ncbi:MAG: cytochrome P450 [Halioglobus sp.]